MKVGTDKDVAEEYMSSLADLTINSKPLINMLTMLAEDYIARAPLIVQAVELHLQKVSCEMKLPALYLIDSIVKNVGQTYKILFTQNIVSTFCSVFEKVDEKVRSQMFKLRQTWNDVFPSKKLYGLDVRVNSIDPAWPITASPPHRIHVNPKFFQPNSPGPLMEQAQPVGGDGVIRDELLKQQKELLELQKRKVELELLQTKAILEEQQKKLENQAASFICDPLLEDNGHKKLLEIGILPITRNTSQTSANSKKTESSFSSTFRTRDPRIKIKEATHSNIGEQMPKTPLTSSTKGHKKVKKHARKRKSSRHNVKKSSSKTSTTEIFLRHKAQATETSVEQNPTEHIADKPLVTHCPSDSDNKTRFTNLDSNEPVIDTTSNLQKVHERKNKNQDGSFSSTIELDEIDTDVSSKRGHLMSVSSSVSDSENPNREPQIKKVASEENTASSKTSSENKEEAVMVPLDIDLRLLPPQKDVDGTQNNRNKSISSILLDPLFGGEDIDLRTFTSYVSSQQDSDSEEINSSDGKLRSPTGIRSSFQFSFSSVPESGSNTSLNIIPPSPPSSHENSPSARSFISTVSSPHTLISAESNVSQNNLESTIQGNISPTVLHGKPVSPTERSSPPLLINSAYSGDSGSTSQSIISCTPSRQTEVSHLESHISKNIEIPFPKKPQPSNTNTSLPTISQSTASFTGTGCEPRQNYDPPHSSTLSPPPPPIISKQGGSEDSLWANYKRKKFVDTRRGRSFVDYRRNRMKRNYKPVIRFKGTADEFNETEQEFNERTTSNYRFIIREAECQLSTGNITFPQYNVMLKQVSAIHGKRRIRQPFQKQEYRFVQPNGPSLNQEFGGRNQPSLVRGFFRKGLNIPLQPRNYAQYERRNSFINRPFFRGPPFVERIHRIQVWDNGPRLPGINQYPPPNWFPRTTTTTTAAAHSIPSVIPPPIPPLMPPFRPRIQRNIFIPRIPPLNPLPEIGRFSFRPPVRPNLPTMSGQPFPPWKTLPSADIQVLGMMANDMMTLITIEGGLKEIRFYGETAVVMMAWDDPREIVYQEGARVVRIDSRKCLLHFNQQYKDIMIDGQLFKVRLGAPSRELYINGLYYGLTFGGPPAQVIIGGRLRSLQLSGPQPKVRIGTVQRTDLVAGKVNLYIDGKLIIPIYLDAKPQRFNIGNVPYIIRFVDALRLVIINGVPFKFTFGGTPLSIYFHGEKHYLKLSCLPPMVKAGQVSLHNMEGKHPTPPGKHNPSSKITTHGGINIGELFQKLVATGIVPPVGQKKESLVSYVRNFTRTSPRLMVKSPIRSNVKTLAKPVIKPVDFTKPETFKIKQPALVFRLYYGIQCSSCGIRFAPEHTVKYSQHLDWHFRQNRKCKEGSRFSRSRPWFYFVSDWIQYQEIEDDDDRAISWFEIQEKKKVIISKGLNIVPTAVSRQGERNASCALCCDKFEEFFHEELEEWHFRNAIRVETNLFHPDCYQEVLANPDSIRPPEPIPVQEVVSHESEPIIIDDVDSINDEHDENTETIPEICGKASELEISSHNAVAAKDPTTEIISFITPEHTDSNEDTGISSEIENIPSKSGVILGEDSDDDILQIEVVIPQIESYEILDDDEEEEIGENEEISTHKINNDKQNCIVKNQGAEDDIDIYDIELENNKYNSVPSPPNVGKTYDDNVLILSEDEENVDYSFVKVKQEKVDFVRPETNNSGNVTVVSSIDGNVELEEATPMFLPRKIKINISSKHTQQMKPNIREINSNIGINEPPPPGEELLPASLKPSIAGKKLIIQDPINKGSETSSLCVIM